MATFIDSVGNDAINASTGAISGFTGGTVSELQDTIGDSFTTTGGNENVIAGSGDDTISVSSGADTIEGGAGNDLLVLNYAADGDNFFSNGTAQITDFTNTTVNFSGIESIDATFGSGSSNVALSGGNDTASMGDGNDIVDTLTGDASVDGGAGTDRWAANLSAETVNLVLDLNIGGVQTIGGGSFVTNIESLTITGGTGNDSLKSTTTIFSPDTQINDVINGFDGDDTIAVGGGSDTTDGGTGNDLLIIDYSADDDNFSSNGVAQITDFVNTSVNYNNFEQFDARFGSGNDNITLGAGDDSISGGNGNDVLNTAAGAAVVDGGLGNDTWGANLSGFSGAFTIDLNIVGIQNIGNASSLINVDALNITGGTGNDSLKSTTTIFSPDTQINDVINGFDGDDTVAVGGGSDTTDGGTGNDLLIIDYSADDDNFSSNGVAQITDFVNTRINYNNFEQFDARFGSGNDNITLGAGDDSISGGNGNDVLNTAAGAAVVDGGLGNDTWGANLSSFSGAFTIDLSVVGIQNIGNASSLTNVEALNVTGGTGNDLLKSRIGDSPDTAINDSINGFDGNDTIAVGGGIDTVAGGNGQDLLIIDYSLDDDNFSSNGPTQINDFANTRIDFTDIEQFDARFGSGSDNITLGAGDDSISGGNGNDILNTAAGAAVVDGGAGSDQWRANLSTFSLAFSLDLNNLALQSIGNGSSLVDIESINITGGTGNDTFLTRTADNPDTQFNDVVNGLDGDDTIRVGNGLDTVDGGLGNDLLIIDYSLDDDSFSSNGPTQINDFANTRVDYTNFERIDIRLGTGNDNITAGSGNDTLDGGNGNDTMNGAAGDDLIKVSSGNDRADGGADNDRLYVDYTLISGNFTGDLSTSGSTLSNGLGTSVNQFNIENFTVLTDAGNDSITVGAGNDSVSTGAGADTVNGGAGDDTIAGGAGADLLDGGTASNDTLSYASSLAAVNIDLSTNVVSGGDAQGDTISGFENVVGSANGDTLTGDSNANKLEGGAGNDTILGIGGADTLAGGAGGGDVLSYAGSGSAVSVNLSTNTVSGGDATGDVISGFERVIGSGFADNLIGTAGFNVLSGGAGDDTIQGSGAGDLLKGETGTADMLSYAGSTAGVSINLATNTASGGDAAGDTISGFEGVLGSALSDTVTGSGASNNISGNDGDDVIEGGTGADTLDGGNGIDTLSYAGSTASVSVNLDTNSAAGGQAAGDVISNFENLVGSGFDDTLTGSSLANSIDGGAGNDTVKGGLGADTLVGGTGVDLLNYSGSNAAVAVDLLANTAAGGHAAGDVISGFESVIGSDFDDQLTGQAGANTLTGGLGNDTLRGGAGGDSLSGGSGVDTLSYAGSSAGVTVDLATGTVSGGDATGDTISSFEGIVGSGFDDVLSGSTLVNRIEGGQGNDTISGSLGADTLDGGLSNADVLSYAASTAAVIVNLDTNTAAGGFAAGDTILNFEGLVGSAFGDTLTGSAGANNIAGGDGNDTIKGGLGADTLAGGVGTDTLDYSGSNAAVLIDLLANTAGGGHAAGDNISGFEAIIGSDLNDRLTGDGGVNSLSGGLGDDTIKGGAGGDSLSGGSGTDTLSYAGSSAAVTVDLSTGSVSGGDAAGDTISSFEGIVGSSFNDVLSGSTLANKIEGGQGNDTINGSLGADTLDGGLSTVDVLSYAASSAAVIVNLATNTAAGGFAAGDTILNFERLVGSAFGDTLTGSTGANRIDGGDGNDTIQGGAGADALIGGLGTADVLSYSASAAGVTLNLSTGTGSGGDAAGDTVSGFENLIGSGLDDTLTGSNLANNIDGGAGNDTIAGGLGADTIRGNLGADMFVYTSITQSVAASSDVITDFRRAQGDKIDVSAIDADVTQTGVQDFTFLTTPGAAFTGAGQIRFTQVGSDTIVELNTDADAAAEGTITLTGLFTLIATDFIV